MKCIETEHVREMTGQPSLKIWNTENNREYAEVKKTIQNSRVRTCELNQPKAMTASFSNSIGRQ